MFGINILDAGLILASALAFTGGLLSFLSPCVLPVVPPYLAYMGGISMGEMTGQTAARRKIIMPALSFVLGLSTVFLLLGFTASAFGSFFLTNQETFARIAGVVVIIFGLHFIGVYRIGILDREARLDAGDRGGSALGAYVLGLAFAFGWTPCIGPTLAAVLTLASDVASPAKGATLAFVYALGIGLPFVAIAAGFGWATKSVGFIKRHLRTFNIGGGVLLIALGILMVTGIWNSLVAWLQVGLIGGYQLGV